MADDLDLFNDDDILLHSFKKIMKVWIIEIYIELDYNTPYTVEDMCPELWKELDTYEKRMAGRAVAFLVNGKELPLNYDGKTPANHRKYTRKA